MKQVKTIYKNIYKKNVKFDDAEIEEYEFHQFHQPISINNLEINKVVVSNKLPFGKQDFKYSNGYKDAKKLDLYAYSMEKLIYVKEI